MSLTRRTALFIGSAALGLVALAGCGATPALADSVAFLRENSR